MQPIADITVHSTDLSSRGLTPTGAPLFRVVWAPSRIDKVLRKDAEKVVEVPRYDAPGWILEKWLDAKALAGEREAFELAVASSEIAMEYPADGDYEFCYDFSILNDLDRAPLIAKVVNFETNNLTFKDRREMIKLREELKATEADKKKDEIIDSAIFGGSSIVDVTGRAYSLPN